jgi:hypothetical protein
MRIHLVFVALAIAAIGSAQITKNGSGYLFRMKHTPGSTYKFGVVSTLATGGSGQGMKFSLPMIWKIVGVSKGIATVDTTVGPITMGKSQAMQSSKNRIKLDNRGRIVGQAGAGQQVTPAYPEKAIKVGASWSAGAPIELPMQGQKKITATYTFKGVRSVGGKPMAELNVKTSGQAVGSGTMLILMSDGSLFQSKIKMDLQMTSPDGQAATYKVTADINRK